MEIQETWKPIKNVELLEGFSASNKGRIRCDKGYKKKGAKRYTFIMEQHIEKSLCKHDTYILFKRKKFWVKSLVANAFGLSGTKEKYILKQIDMNPWNNSPDNLIFVDTCTNIAIKRINPSKIDLNDAKLKEEIEEVKHELHEFLGYRKRRARDTDVRYKFQPKHPLTSNFKYVLLGNFFNNYDDCDSWDGDDEMMNPYNGDF